MNADRQRAKDILNNLLQSGTVQDDELQHIHHTLSMGDFKAKIIVIQLISSCLKRNRRNSHPERGLGKRGLLDDGNSKSVVTDCILLDRFEACFQTTWNQFSSPDRPHHELFFLIALCGDVIKTIKVIRKSCAHSASNQQFTSLQTCIQTTLCQFILENYRRIDLTPLPESCVYWQSLTKAIQVCLFLINDDSVDITSLLEIGSVASSSQPVLRYFQQSPDSEDANDCNVICQTADNHARIIVITFIVTALNGLLKVCCVNGASWKEETQSEVNSVVCVLHSVVAYFVSNFGPPRLIKLLCADDKNLILCLLQLIEIELRVQFICPLKVSDKMIRKGPDYAPQGSLTEASVCSSICAVETLFLHFLDSGIHFDNSLLLDLLCNTETSALQYILRVTKVLAASTDKLRDVAAAWKITTNTHRCRKQRSSDSVDKCIVLGQPFSVLNSEVLRVACIEWLRTDSEQVPVEVDELSSLNCKNVTLSTIRTFLIELRDTLLARAHRSLLPFNPGLLCQRLNMIARNLQ